MLRLIGRSVPYLWIILNLYAFYNSYVINGYHFLGKDQVKMLEYATSVYPFQSTDIAHYDISELLFFCIVPIYLYILINRLVVSFIARD